MRGRMIILAINIIALVSTTALGNDAVTPHYILKYSEDDELCRYVTDYINFQTDKLGSYKAGEWNSGDQKISIFKSIDWRTFPRQNTTHYAVFDIDNDGVEEFVVNSWADMRNGLFVFKKDSIDTSVKFSIKEQVYSDSAIALGTISLNRWSYKLTKLNDKPTPDTLNYHVDDKSFSIFGTFDVQPFIFKGVTYISLTDGAEKPYKGKDPIDGLIKVRREFIVIGKYLGGYLSARRTPQKDAMEDICYLEKTFQN